MATTQPGFQPGTTVVGAQPPLRAATQEFRVAAFGDSMMWGQGLSRNDRFSSRITTELANKLKKAPRLLIDRSRSGAQISATIAQRSEFVATFPEIFRNQVERVGFVFGEEDPATRLYGENPATFPTVRWQVAAVPDDLGATINLALVIGGANDIGFDQVLNPQEFPGAFIEQFEGRISSIAYQDTLDLIARVRSKCPKAVIMQFGYGRPLSYRSRISSIRAFFKHEFNDDIGWFLNKVFNVVSIDDLIHEARIRSEWAASRAQHWMCKAVADANADPDIRGPGIIFVPAPFESINAAFSVTPYVFDDYTHPTSDPAHAERVSRIPRIDQLQRLRVFRLALSAGAGIRSADSQLESLRKDLTGPKPLVDALARGIDSAEKVGSILELVEREISRIQRALIASFLHPNTDGARAYADLAIARYEKHIDLARQVRRKERTRAPTTNPAGVGELEQAVTRFGLRGQGSLLADIGHRDIDALTVTVVTASASDPDLYCDMSLLLQMKSGAIRSHRLNFPYRIGTVLGQQNQIPRRKLYPHFEPGQTNVFSVAEQGTLELVDIGGFSIVMLRDLLEGSIIPHGTVWRPRRVRLELNGRVVSDVTYRGSRTGVTVGDSLALPLAPSAALNRARNATW